MKISLPPWKVDWKSILPHQYFTALSIGSKNEHETYGIGEIYMIHNEIHPLEKSKANARLIERAPEMYRKLILRAAEREDPTIYELITYIEGEPQDHTSILKLADEIKNIMP